MHLDIFITFKIFFSIAFISHLEYFMVYLGRGKNRKKCSKKNIANMVTFSGKILSDYLIQLQTHDSTLPHFILQSLDHFSGNSELWYSAPYKWPCIHSGHWKFQSEKDVTVKMPKCRQFPNCELSICACSSEFTRINIRKK